MTQEADIARALDHLSEAHLFLSMAMTEIANSIRAQGDAPKRETRRPPRPKPETPDTEGEGLEWDRRNGAIDATTQQPKEGKKRWQTLRMTSRWRS